MNFLYAFVALLLVLGHPGHQASAERAEKKQTAGSSPVNSPPPDLGGVRSAYTDVIARLADTEIRNPLKPSPDVTSIELHCLTTPDQDLYIGLEQREYISAPLKSVTAILDDFSIYQALFPGFSDIHLIESKGEISYSYWEQTVPLPFIPNVKYEMIYLTTMPKSGMKLYRYQLRKQSTLLASDGFILVSAEGENGTRFTEFDFFNAKWGAAKAFGHRKLWLDAIEGMARSDLAIKLKAEHPDWKPRKARDESRKVLPETILRTCYDERKPWDGR